MLLTPYIPHNEFSALLGASLALATGFSNNLIIFGSLAGIIVVEQAAKCGIQISFGAFARSGVPVTLATLLLGVIWILAAHVYIQI